MYRKSKNFLSVNFDYTPEQIALAQKLGSKNRTESFAAAEAVAAVAAQPLLEVIQQAPVFSNLYERQSYGPGDMPVITLSPLFDTKQPGYMSVFSVSAAGGLSSNEMTGANELVVQVRNMSGAADLDKKYMRSQKPRLNVLSDALARLAQEVLLKENRDATAVLMGALANSFIDGNSANTATSNYQIFRTNTQGVFSLVDFNSIMTKYRRIVSSWVGGTPVGVNSKITDLFGSPEWMEQIRSIAYQPVNTRNGATTSSGATSLAATDEVRNRIFNSAGLPSLFDVNLHEYNELGVGQIYNNVFASYATGTYAGYSGGSAATFNSATEQVVVGLNLDWQDLVSLTQVELGGAEWSLSADDQFPNRADKIGFYGAKSTGYVSVDNRGKLAVIF
jgi:hypothetical protein